MAKVAPKYRKMVKTRTGICDGKKTAADFNKAAKAYKDAKVGNVESEVRKLVKADKIKASEAKKRVAKAKKEADAVITKQRQRNCPT